MHFLWADFELWTGIGTILNASSRFEVVMAENNDNNLILSIKENGIQNARM